MRGHRYGVIHADVLSSRTSGTHSQHLEAIPKYLLFGNLDVFMDYTASILIILSMCISTAAQ
jgi:hypothetical protein